MLVVDRLQLRDQLDTTMMNMNIDKSMFLETVDKNTFIEALDSLKPIIVVNIQQFLDLQKAINESGTKLRTMRVAFLIDEDTSVEIRQSKESVYSYEPRIRKIAKFVVDRLVSLVYGKIRGEGKAMLVVSSIPNAIKYIEVIRNLYAEKCKEKQYKKYADAPICIVYSDN